MKNIIKKISLSLLTLLLVFTSVSSYEFTQPKAQVQANEFTLTDLPAKLLAIVLTAIGVTIASDVTLNDMQNIYDNLDANAKAVIAGFDYVNKEASNYFALTISQLQTLASGLIKSMNLDDLKPGSKYYLQDNFLKEFITASSITALGAKTIHFNDSNHYYEFQGFSSSYYPGTFVNRLYQRKSENVTQTITWNGVSVNLHNAFGTFKISLTIGLFPYEDFTNKLVGMVAGKLYLGFKQTCEVYTAGSLPVCSTFSPGIYTPVIDGINKVYEANQADLAAYVSLIMSGGGLTLPAPLGGWDTSQAGDIDVPNDWTKRILDATGLPLVVLGGLTIDQLLDLKNKGPQDVLVGGDLPGGVQDVLVGGEVNTGVDVLNPTFPDINIGEALADMAGWLSGALGALSGAIAGTIGNAANALTGLGTNIWNSIKDILALLGGLVGAITLAMTNTADYILSGLEALLATLAASLLLPFQGFSWPDLTANWDWLKTLLNFIKDFFIALWELLKFFLSLFQYLFTWFLTLLNLLYESFFVGLATTLILLSSRIKALLSVLPTPLDTIAQLTYDLALFGMVLAIIRNVLFLLRGKK